MRRSRDQERVEWGRRDWIEGTWDRWVMVHGIMVHGTWYSWYFGTIPLLYGEDTDLCGYCWCQHHFLHLLGDNPRSRRRTYLTRLIDCAHCDQLLPGVTSCCQVSSIRPFPVSLAHSSSCVLLRPCSAHSLAPSVDPREIDRPTDRPIERWHLLIGSDLI